MSEISKYTRPSWDEYFSIIAEDVALRSTCIRHKFGCVIVKDTKIVATGYNGATRKSKHCLNIGCLRDEMGISSGKNVETCRGVHAEQNALLQAGEKAKGATLYVNGHPCSVCAKLMINAEIKRVVISGDYADKSGVEILRNAGVEVREIFI